MALVSHWITEIPRSMRSVTATELSSSDLLIGERESQERVPSGGHRAGGREPVGGSRRCTRTAREKHGWLVIEYKFLLLWKVIFRYFAKREVTFFYLNRMEIEINADK